MSSTSATTKKLNRSYSCQLQLRRHFTGKASYYLSLDLQILLHRFFD